MVFHAGRHVAGSLPDQAWRWGEFGVDVFFVVSGFVMMVAVPTGAGVREFAWRRAVRILPMYWLATLSMAGLLLAAPHLFSSAVLTPQHFVASLLLVPHHSPATGEIVPLLVPGWTLSYELYFYAVFALFLRCRAGWRVLGVAGVLLLFAVVGAWFQGHAIGEFLHRDIVWEFVLGLIAGALWLRGRRCDVRLAWPLAWLAMTAIAMFAGADAAPWRLAIVGGASLLLVWAVASARSPRALAALGDASYSLYLLHPFVVGAVWFAWQRLGLGIPYGFIAACVCASTIAGWVAWRLIEAPMTRRLRSVVPA